MGRPVFIAKPGFDRCFTAGAGRGARRGAQSVRRRAQPRREQTEDLPAAGGEDTARLYVRNAAQIRNLFLTSKFSNQRFARSVIER